MRRQVVRQESRGVEVSGTIGCRGVRLLIQSVSTMGHVQSQKTFTPYVLAVASNGVTGLLRSVKLIVASIFFEPEHRSQDLIQISGLERQGPSD